MTSHTALAVLAALSLSCAGCFDFGSRTYFDPGPEPTARASHAPSIEEIGLAKYQPLSKLSKVQVIARDLDGDLARVQFRFAKNPFRLVSGTQASAFMTGQDLGEGFGTLEVEVDDVRGGRALRDVSDVLVDLTPPKIVLGQSVLPAGGELEFWVGDAWILGGVTLEYAGTTQQHAFEYGFPDTLGKTWDYSLVKFPLAGLPSGTAPATITARDAAGNTSTESFDLVIDGDPPSVSIDAPSDGATVSGSFDVSLSASDPGGGPVWTSVSLGGTPVGNAASATASLEVSTKDFGTGPSELVVVGIDRAGNQSTAKITLNVQ